MKDTAGPREQSYRNMTKINIVVNTKAPQSVLSWVGLSPEITRDNREFESGRPS